MCVRVHADARVCVRVRARPSVYKWKQQKQHKVLTGNKANRAGWEEGSDAQTELIAKKIDLGEKVSLILQEGIVGSICIISIIAR